MSLSDFKVGDKVRLVNNPSYMDPGWAGMEAEVISLNTELEHLELQPLRDRPDGFGREPFQWEPEDWAVVREDTTTKWNYCPNCAYPLKSAW